MKNKPTLEERFIKLWKEQGLHLGYANDKDKKILAFIIQELKDFSDELVVEKKYKKCLCGELLNKDFTGYHNCGAFTGHLQVNTERVVGFNEALEDIETKKQELLRERGL